MNAVTKEQWPVNAEPILTVGRGEIAAAFAKAQLEMHNPKFDSANPFFKSKFASLAAVRNAVIPLFAKYQIATAQDLITADGSISCFTILTHASGQEMRFGPLTLPVSKDDAQGYAASGTYAKRIQLQAVAGVVGDEDNDGNDVGKPTNGAYAEPHQPKGDLGKSVPVDRARGAATAMLAIINKPAKDGDHDEMGKAVEALDYHNSTLNPDPDLYVAAGEELGAPKRNIWKALVKRAQEAEKADRASSPTNGRRF